MSGRVARIARIAIAAGGTALLILGLAAWALAHSGAVNVWLTARLTALLGPQVHFATARALWWPRPGVVLDDVSVVAAGTPAESGAAATAVTCHLGLEALLAGRVEVAGVQIDGLRVTVERAADGSLHSSGLEQLAAAAPGGDGAAGLPAVQVRDGELLLRAAGDSATPTLRFHPLTAQLNPSGAGAGVQLDAQIDGGGSLRARGAIDAPSLDAHFSATVETDQIDAAALLAWLPPAAQRVAATGRLRLTATLAGQATATIDGDGTLELADGALTAAGWQVAAPLHLAAHVAWNGTALTLSGGRVDAAQISGSGVSADTIEASFAYADGTLRLDSAQLRACGGTWRPVGSITLGEPPTIDGSIEAEQIDAAQLAAALRAAGLSASLPLFTAPLRLSAAASGAIGGDWSGRAAIESSGAATIGTVRADGPLRLAADVQAHGAALALSNGRLQARRVALGALAADAVDGAFTYANGAVAVAPLRCTAFGGAWTYSGTLPLAAAPWRGTLTATQVSTAALRSALAAPDADDVTEGTVTLDAQLVGTGVDMVSATARLASTRLIWNALRIVRPFEVTGALRLQGGRLTLTDGRARFGTGRLHVGGTLALSGAPSWSATVEAHHVDPDAIVDALDGVPGKGPRTVNAIADISLTLAGGTGAPRGSATVMLATGAFIWGALRVDGPAHAKGTFSIHGDDFTLGDVTADAARAAYTPVIGTAATAQFHYADDRLSFTTMRFRSCGGTWTNSGWLTLAPGGQFAGQVGIAGLSPPGLAAMLDEPGLELPFARLDLDTEFDGHATPDWLSTVRATGTVFLSDGTMRATTVLRPIWEALGVGRMMNMVDRATTHVEEVSDTFTLRRGRADTADLSMISDDFTLTALGSVELDGRLDLTARIQLTSQGAQRMFVIGSLPLPTSALPRLPPIPTRITGTISAPIFRPNVSALPASTLGWLVDAAMHTPRNIGGAIVDGLGRLWNGAKRVVGAGGPAAEP